MATTVTTDIRWPQRRPRAYDRDATAHPGVWLCGGGDLAGTLVDQVDRLVLKVNPLLLGDGPCVLSGSYAARGFVLDRARTFDSGVVVAEYVRADQGAAVSAGHP